MAADSDRTVFTTPWFSVISRDLRGGEPYYMLRLSDYVSVIAVTTDDRLVLVRQYRPVVERETLELPSGHVEDGESPEEAARRELLEETGYTAEHFDLLGALAPDVGRLSNRMWCYFARDVSQNPDGPPREAGLTVVELPRKEAFACVADGRIDHALNIAPLLLAIAQRKFELV